MRDVHPPWKEENRTNIKTEVQPLRLGGRETSRLLVRPAGPHQVIHLGGTVCRRLHAFSTLNHLHNVVSFHSLQTTRNIFTHSRLIFSAGFLLLQPWSASAMQPGSGLPPGMEEDRYLVGLLAVGEGLPHQHPEAPHVAFGGKLEVVYAFWSVPLDWPLPMTFGLKQERDISFLRSDQVTKG